MLDQAPFLLPDWPAPASIRAYTTTRCGGDSVLPWDGFNLADYVGDDPDHVAANRQALTDLIGLPSEPYWLDQTHGTAVSRLDTRAADAAYTAHPGKVCVVLSADCLPVLLTNQAGDQVAAVHAGWRGLAAGILEASVAAFHPTDGAGELMAWLGPAISQQAFIVGDQVREAFVQHQSQAAQAFIADQPGTWRADLYQLARQRLQAVGVNNISGGDYCTYTDTARFYSYRRASQTGRMATLIWIAS